MLVEVVKQCFFISTAINLKLRAITLNPYKYFVFEDVPATEQVLVGEFLIDVNAFALILCSFFEELKDFYALFKKLGLLRQHLREEHNQIPLDVEVGQNVLCSVTNFGVLCLVVDLLSLHIEEIGLFLLGDLMRLRAGTLNAFDGPLKINILFA